MRVCRMGSAPSDRRGTVTDWCDVILKQIPDLAGSYCFLFYT